MTAQSASGAAASAYPKQAIVVLHGMGEQRPMDTIRGFARAVWTCDADVHRNDKPDPGAVWSHPDDRTGSLELRRLTTRGSTPTARHPRGLRQDFYELYWADLSGGSTMDRLMGWLFMLMWRNPVTRVPPDVRLTWGLLWLLAAALVALLVLLALASDSWPLWLRLLLLGGAVVAVAAGAAVHRFGVRYLGRVVRYTQATPDNIAARQAIRRRGLKLLDALHAGEYERIVLVGHSLGAIVAYELLAYLWAEHAAARTLEEGTDEFEQLCALEAASAAVAAAPDARKPGLLASYETARHALCRCLRQRAKPPAGAPDRRWLITDLVTLGSPLGHAEFLLAHDAKDLQARKNERELATCPPLREPLDEELRDAARAAGLLTGDARLSCFSLKHDGQWQLHHAAQFAVVRWTNIHDPARWVAWGDQVSAPAAPAFGPGVKDVNLRQPSGTARFFTHLDYWQEGTRALDQLRAALDLAARDSP